MVSISGAFLLCPVKAGIDAVYMIVSGLACIEEEWGKSLALCGPGAELPGVTELFGEEAKSFSYQERFVKLQGFLKKCDEDDQSYLLDALQSLSTAGRSSHAVGLEQRALWLSIEVDWTRIT